MSRRAVAIGLDGSAWHLVDPLIEQGAMPRLGALKERGASGTLTSTVPTYTPPAWTSATTGVNPGRHGIYGFVATHAQHPRPELMHYGMIKAPTVWEMAAAQGARSGAYHVPLTYPPQELDGWMVSGMMTPGHSERPPRFTYPPELEGRIHAWAPGYACDVSANWEQDWRDASLCERIIASLQQRYDVLGRLLSDHPVDLVFAVMESPDRLQHVYYRYMDPADPLYATPQAQSLRPHIARCFEAMDRIVGLLDDYAGADGGVIVCSDHGFTAWEMSVHTNTLLADWGYLRLKPGARALQTDAARRIVPIAKRFLPAKVARSAKTKTFAAIDWSRTSAFATPIPQQGIFVNLQGRETYGIVPPSELETLKEEIAERFRTLCGPDGRRVTDRVYKSQDVFSGDAQRGAPDVLPVLADHRFELDDELFHKDPFSDLRHLPRGAHHPDGIVVLAAPGVRPETRVDGSILDVTPTLLYMAGLKVPEGLDGAVLTGAFDPNAFEDRPLQTTSALSSQARDESSPYSEEEEALIEESLKGLGYL
ncbi:MAG: alkaline phosphatase family protein [Actinomycetota bacterium]